ncbi:MAG: RimK family alpha-L-glutamate ligase [Allosphingosinicella sp.]
MYEHPLKIRFARLAAAELGYSTETIDRFSHYLIKVSNGPRFTFVGSGNVHSYPINNATISSIATDKSHTATLLEQIGVDVPRSRLVFLDDRFADFRPEGRDISEARAFAASLGYPVFVKPNEGSRGIFAQSVADEAALERHLKAIASRYYSAVVQEYLHGEEERIFYIDGEPYFAYRKTRPFIIGDGHRTIGELLEEVDRKLRRSGLSPTNRSDPVLTAGLEKEGLSPDDVAPAGTRLPFAEKANLSWGGGVMDFREHFSDRETELCRKIHGQTGLRVCAIDLLRTEAPAGGREVVIELNANPALASVERMGRTDLLKRIWKAILAKAIGD